MKKIMKQGLFTPVCLVCLALFVFIVGCTKVDVRKLKNYEQIKLVANNSNYGAPNIDPL